MAQITSIPTVELIARQDQGGSVDLNSLLTAGLSVFSSLTSELSLSVSEDTSNPTETSSSSQYTFQTSSNSVASTSTGSSPSSDFATISSMSSSSTASPSFSSSGFQSLSTSGSAASNKGSPNPTNSGNGSSSKVPIIVGVVLGIVVLCLLGLLIYLCCRRHRRQGVIFGKRRAVTPSVDSDSEFGNEPTLPVTTEPDIVETTAYNQYPPVPPPHQLSSMHRHGGDLGYMSNGDPFDDTNPSVYDRRVSRRSLPLNPANEHLERGRSTSESAMGYGNRRWSASSANGYMNGTPGVPPRSPQRRSIPRKPVPTSAVDERHGFNFGFPPNNGYSQAGSNGSGRYYDRGRHSWQNGSPY